MIYLDTSAFFKLYLRAEITNALRLKVFRGQLEVDHFLTFDSRLRELARLAGLSVLPH